MNDELRNLLYRPNEDTIFMTEFNEDEVVHNDSWFWEKHELLNKLAELRGERDQLREALKNVRECTELTAPAMRLNALLHIEEIVETALQEDGDE